MQVLVRDNNVDQALKALKKKMQREGIFREMKLRGHYEKPSEKKAREKAEAIRRARKLARKKMQREGLLPCQAASRSWRRPGLAEATVAMAVTAAMAVIAPHGWAERLTTVLIVRWRGPLVSPRYCFSGPFSCPTTAAVKHPRNCLLFLLAYPCAACP